jgi:hypothetical protein
VALSECRLSCGYRVTDVTFEDRWAGAESERSTTGLSSVNQETFEGDAVGLGDGAVSGMSGRIS